MRSELGECRTGDQGNGHSRAGLNREPEGLDGPWVHKKVRMDR